jgi:hypothetical protein
VTLSIVEYEGAPPPKYPALELPVAARPLRATLKFAPGTVDLVSVE